MKHKKVRNLLFILQFFPKAIISPGSVKADLLVQRIRLPLRAMSYRGAGRRPLRGKVFSPSMLLYVS